MSVKRLNQLGKVSKYIMGVAIILMAITVYFSYMTVFYIALGLFLIGLLMNLILSVLKPFIMDKVLDIEALEKQGVVNVQNLSIVAPSFAASQAQTASGTVVLRIRGVGTTSNNIGFESAVGVFIDGAYQSRPGIALGEFVDVDSVEVLRGPQGTLFGRNTSAGALKIVNKAPDLAESGGFVNATYGNYGHKSVQGAVNIPLVEDKLALRLTGAYRDREGYLKLFDGNGNRIGESNGIDQHMLRAQLGFELDSGFKGRFIADHSASSAPAGAALEVQQSPVETAGLFSAVGLGARGGMVGNDVAIGVDDTDGAQDAVDNLVGGVSFEPNPSMDQSGFLAELEYPLGANADLIYGGNPAKWRKLANSLMLRYYMRVSTKLPAYAKAGIEEIVSNAAQYPIFTSILFATLSTALGTSTNIISPLKPFVFTITPTNK